MQVWYIGHHLIDKSYPPTGLYQLVHSAQSSGMGSSSLGLAARPALTPPPRTLTCIRPGLPDAPVAVAGALVGLKVGGCSRAVAWHMVVLKVGCSSMGPGGPQRGWQY